MKNITKTTNRKAMLLIAFVAAMLLGLRNAEARSNCVFALTDSETESQFSPQKYYYGNYEKGEPTRALTGTYIQIKSAPRVSDTINWNGTYLMVGQNTATTYYAYKGGNSSNSDTVTVTVDNNKKAIINPLGKGVEVKIEYVGTASKVNYYRMSYTTDKTYYIGSNTSGAGVVTTNTKPTDLSNNTHKQYLWKIEDATSSSYGNIKLINRRVSAYFGYYGYTKNFVVSTTSSLYNDTPNYGSSSGVYSNVKLYKKVPTYNITIDDGISDGTIEINKAFAHEGATVTVTTHPAINYATTGVTYTPSGGTATNATGDAATSNTFTFIMPASDVEVSATFGAGESSTYHEIVCTPSSTTPNHGYIEADTYSAAPGTFVTITPHADENYIIYSMSYTPEGGEATTIDLDTRQFSMPTTNVTVTATFGPLFIRETDMAHDKWSGKYILGYHSASYESEFGFSGSTSGGTTVSSGAIPGTTVTMSEDLDSIIRVGNSVVYTIEYGGKWSSTEVSGADTINIGKSYYRIYYLVGETKTYVGIEGTGSSIRTSTSPGTSKNYKWSFFKNSSGQFQIRNFYGTYFVYAQDNRGVKTNGSYGTINRITYVTSGATAGEGYTIPAANDKTNHYVYLYRWNEDKKINVNIIGSGSINVGGDAYGWGDGYIAYPDATATITPVPESGYSLSSISMIDEDGNTVALTGTASGVFQFTMPAKNVTLNVWFTSSDCKAEGGETGTNGTVGGGTFNNANTWDGTKMPYANAKKYSYKQFIFSGADIPEAISSIGFMFYAPSGGDMPGTTDVSVYMMDTTLTSFTKTSDYAWIDTSTMTRVYNGPMEFKASEASTWKYFVFNKNGNKFRHDKSKNLIVAILNNSGVTSTGYSYRGFYYSNDTAYRQIYTYPSDTQITFTDGIPSSHEKYKSQYFPLTKFCGPELYTVTCATGLTGGSISASPNKESAGNTITITAVPESGYTLSTVTATNETTSETLTVSGTGNTRTFIMPEANVTVTATFAVAGGGDTWVDNVTSEPAGYVVDGSGNVTISSADGLAWLISVVNGLNGQTADDLDGTTVVLTRDLDMTASAWVPIGYSSSTAFAGTFNGNNHTISNLHIASSEISDVETAAGSAMQYTGLFGYTDGATIKNVVLTNDCEFANNNASGSIGSIVGYANGGTIEFCQSEASLAAAGNITAMGGMVGTAASANVNGVTSLVSMAHGENNVTSVGGVVGTGGTVKTYIANNTISGTGTVTNKSAVANSATVSNGYVLSTNSGYTVASGTGYAPGDYTAVTPYTYGSNSNTVGNVPMVNMLNSGTPATNMAWKQAKGTKINGGYPIIVRTDDAAPMGCVKNGNLLRHDNVNTLLTAAASTDTVFMYGSGAITLSSAPSCKFYIDEDAALTQANDIAINATVGITFDNTAGNGEKSRDWHAFSSALTAASIGISYGGSQVHEYGANDLPLGGATGFSLTQGNAAVYFPDGITTANGCDGTEFDLYAYSEPNYHWVNMKRKTGNHFYEDTHEAFSYTNESTYTPGHGYFLAIGDNSTAKYTLLQATGILNNSTVEVTDVTNSGSHLPGYNLLGNPYQSYLDFNAFATANSSSLWNDDNEAIGYKAYLIYDADVDGFKEYLVDDEGKSFSQNAANTTEQYLHPHQGFFVVKKIAGTTTVRFTDAMRSTTATSAYRDEKPSYPLINLICTDSEGRQEVSVIEFERPSVAGSLKMKGMLNSNGDLYIRYNGEDFGSMFLSEVPEILPLWFRALEDGVFTLSWSTANGEFNNLHLIDNLTGADIDCNAAQSYTFESKQTDSKARFRLVFTPYGIEEETAEGESFAFISNGELIVTGNGELSLIDLNGRVLTTEHIAGEQSRIGLPAVAEGMYLLRLTSNKGVRMQKIVVRR